MFGCKQNTRRKYGFIRTCKAIHERIQQNIKAKRKIPILYCKAKQLIEVKFSFAFGYWIGSAGKYLVPKMHLTQLKIINSIMIYILISESSFSKKQLLVMKRASCITPIMHAGKRYGSFFAGNSPPDFQLH
jgi:hypothetical protein